MYDSLTRGSWSFVKTAAATWWKRVSFCELICWQDRPSLTTSRWESENNLMRSSGLVMHQLIRRAVCARSLSSHHIVGILSVGGVSGLAVAPQPWPRVEASRGKGGGSDIEIAESGEGECWQRTLTLEFEYGRSAWSICCSEFYLNKLWNTLIWARRDLPNPVTMRKSCKHHKPSHQQVSYSIQIGHIHLEQHFIGSS